MPVWELIKNDVEKGAHVLVKEYAARLYATAFRICLNETDAEDLVFRTLERVVEKIASFRGDSSFFTWMCAILVNFHRINARRKSTRCLSFVDEIPEMRDERPSPAVMLAASDDASAIRAAVSALPEDFRIAVVLHYFDGMSVRAVAKALSIAEGTVYWRLHEGRARIREALSKVRADRGI